MKRKLMAAEMARTQSPDILITTWLTRLALRYIL
jgi:hypothetical protein